MKQIVLYALTISLLLSGIAAYAQPQGGQIAITASDGNIQLYDVSSGTLTSLTTDATFRDPQKYYSWPTWSTDGRLAFFGINLDPTNTYRLGIFIQKPGGVPKGVFASEDEIFTYAYWAPSDCPAGNCRDLALLYSNEGGLAARLVRSADEVTITEISQGGPFYWDWSPDGSEMFWARYGQSLEIYDVASGQVSETLPDQQGIAQTAVDWSPVDDRLLAAVAAIDGSSSLVIYDGADKQTLVSGFASGIAFAWSPDASNVAFLDWTDGSLKIVDPLTQQIVAQPAYEALAFFWSPDGSKLAFISFAPEIDRPSTKRMQSSVPVLQWNMYDLAQQQVIPLAEFVPTDDMIYYLNFFDQFLHSHRLWSPDSRYLTYGTLLEDGSQAVMLLDTSTPNAVPKQIADGSIGVFSWQ